MSDIFEDHPKSAHNEPTGLPSDLGSVSCHVCGFTGEDLQRTGRLGCAECYDVFRESLVKNLPEMHKGGERHRGRVPPSFETQRLESVLKESERQLAEAIASETFEEAARQRDHIVEIKKQLSHRSALSD